MADILKHDNNEKSLELFDALTDMNFVIDISDVLDIYENVYGMEWLKNFYKLNSEELCEYF